MALLNLFLEQEGPVPHAVLARMRASLGLAESRNVEILFRWCQLCLGAGDESVLPDVERVVAQHGRMKYLRPLYT